MSVCRAALGLSARRLVALRSSTPSAARQVAPPSTVLVFPSLRTFRSSSSVDGSQESVVRVANGWPSPDGEPLDLDSDAPYGYRFVNERGHPAESEYFNGLLRSEHIVAALRLRGPQTAQQLWEGVSDVSGIASKRRMKKLIDVLTRSGRIVAVPGEDKAFVYHALRHRKNDFEIPGEMKPVGPEDGVKMDAVARAAKPNPVHTPRWSNKK